jgi:putative transposase
LSLLLEIAQLPRATFYYHLKRIQKADKYAEAKAEIGAIFHENKGRYGYRRITMALRGRGFLLNHKTVQRLMKELDLVCRVRIKKYCSYKGEVGKIASNLLNRDFRAEKPNQKWVTDVTEFSLYGQKLYFSPILDLHNGYLVSYTISERPVLNMVTTMLEKAYETIPDGTGLIHHSDQGWQYQHKIYQYNAVMENFFAYSKVSCCTCKSLNPWNTLSRS